jgi:hypothetical protein
MSIVFSFELVIVLSFLGSGGGTFLNGNANSRISAECKYSLLGNVCNQRPRRIVGQVPIMNLGTLQGMSGLEKEICQAPESRISPRTVEHQQQEINGRRRLAASEAGPEEKAKNVAMHDSRVVRFVSSDGDDTNDGWSWNTAKRTIYGALISLPGGNPKLAGSGTIYVGPASYANPTPNAGIWLLGPRDPNYAHPPAGWLGCDGCALSIIGVSNATTGPNGHKPRIKLIAGGDGDTNHPGLWLSATNGSMYFANIEISYPGRAVVIGECSNHNRKGVCQSSAMVFENVSALLSQKASNGPCTDITGSSFWIWLRDYGCGGNATAAAGGRFSNQAAAILIDGSNNSGNGLVFVRDANLSAGGIKFIGGANGGSLYADDIIEEGDFIHDIPPAVWFTDWSSAMDSRLNDIQMADTGPTPTPIIENDGSPGSTGPTVINSGWVRGPATIINPTGGIPYQLVSPLRQGQTGFIGGYVIGETDVARRIAGLIPARYVNRAASDPATWTYTNADGKQFLTRGKTDPFGGSSAASISSSSSKQEAISLGACSAYRPTKGDWIVVGIWEKGWPPTNTYLTATCYGYGFPKVSATFQNKGLLTGEGQWTYQWAAFKVESGPDTQIGATGIFDKTITPTLFGPTLYIIPAGTSSDNEVLEFASTMNSVDSTCPIGSTCNVAGHPLTVSKYQTLSNCTSNTSPANCDAAPAGSVVLSVGSTVARINTTAVTPNSQIMVIEDSSLGTKLGVTCNRIVGRTYMISERTPGLGFSVRSSVPPVDLPACLSFQLLN